MTTLRAWEGTTRIPGGSTMGLYVDLDTSPNGGYRVYIIRAHGFQDYREAEMFAQDAAGLLAKLYGPVRELSHNGIIERDRKE